LSVTLSHMRRQIFAAGKRIGTWRKKMVSNCWSRDE
jgi:hypothetical protein